MKKVWLLLVILLVTALSACRGDDGDDRPVIYVTVYPMEFLVSELAGDLVVVKHVPGVTSHGASVDWSGRDIIDMNEADLLFYVHAGADDYIPNNANVFEDGDVELVNMSQHLTYNLVCYQHSHEEEDGLHQEEPETCDSSSLTEDPHFWLDPVLMADAAAFVKDKLISTYPEQETLINNNYTVLSSSLEKLHQDFQAMADLATKPIITTVMLFTYWHARYDIDILSITSDAHSSESNPGDLIELLEHALEHDIHHVLFERNANSPAGSQLLSDLRLQVPDASALYLHGMGKLTEDEYDAGATYLTLMYDNLDALELATK
jgi:zinc transport system substrate-binding protein